MKKYDYLIVGAGLFGAVFAHEAAQKGKTCLVIDKRSYWRKYLYRRSRRDPGTQIRSPYFPYIKEECVGIREPVCRL